MIVVNIAMSVADGLAYFLEGRQLPMVRETIIAANAVFFAAFALFGYLMMLYLHYRAYGDSERLRKIKIPAALFMMVSKTLLKNQLMSGCDPATALERVNVQLCDRNSSMMFVTVWLAVIEISTGRGKACNAGHENPVMKRAGGEYEVLRYRHNMALGISKMAKYTVREFELHPGDSLFVYTDGVPEATNNAMEMFGEDRLVSTLNRNRDTQPKEVIVHMREAVDAFADGAPQFDDVTMLCLKYLGRRED